MRRTCYGGDKTIAALRQASQLAGQMRALGSKLDASTADSQSIAVWANPMLTALNSSPTCNADPSCQNSRAGLAALVQANNSGLLAQIQSMARSMQLIQPMQSTGQQLDKVKQSLDQAVDAMTTIKGLPATMSNLQRGSVFSLMAADNWRVV